MTKTVKMRYCPDFDVTTTVTLEGKRVVELRGVADDRDGDCMRPAEAEALAMALLLMAARVRNLDGEPQE